MPIIPHRVLSSRYFKRVLSYGPIAYWPLWEPGGTVAYDLANPIQNGAHIGVTLGQPGIGDGNTCPFFDGLNDATNVYSVSFRGAFDGSEGTVAAWARVNGAANWTDGAWRHVIRFQVDANNYIILIKTNVNNQFAYWYNAGGVLDSVNLATNSVDWMHIAMTWSASAVPTGELRAYYNGAQTGATQVGLGVWAGLLAAATTVIGAQQSPAPNQVWHGRIAHVAVWDRPLSAGPIMDLATV